MNKTEALQQIEKLRIAHHKGDSTAAAKITRILSEIIKA